MIRWWPVLALAGLTLLRLAVGAGSTPADDVFQRLGAEHPGLGRLLWVTDPRVVFVPWAITVAVVLLRRRWRSAAVVAVAPLVAVAVARLLKRLFGRYKGDALAYPSGHTTLLVVVLGLAVLVLGAMLWTVLAAAVVVLLGAFGQAVTYHYFTDTIGAMLLGTALLCLAARAAKLDRCQPGCDVRHSHG